MLQLLFFEHINKFDFTKVISTFRNISDLTAFQQLARRIYTKLQNVLWNFKFKPSDPKYDIKNFIIKYRFSFLKYLYQPQKFISLLKKRDDYKPFMNSVINEINNTDILLDIS